MRPYGWEVGSNSGWKTDQHEPSCHYRRRWTKAARQKARLLARMWEMTWQS